MSLAERTQLAVLTRAFVSRMFEGNSSANSIARVQFAIWSIALLTGPTFQAGTRAFKKYDWVARRTPDLVDVATWGDKLFYLGFSMLGIGLLALVVWDGIFPDRRDATTFGSLPVRTRTLVLSRLAALAAVAFLFVIGFNVPAMIVYAPATGLYYGQLGSLRHVAAHAAANVAIALTVFACVVALQTVVINLLGARGAARATLALQVLLVIAVVQGVMLFPGATGVSPGRPPQFDAMNPWSPPLWYLGMYETIAGSARPEWRAFGARGAFASAAIGIVALLSYALTYRRMAVRALEAADLSPRKRGRLFGRSTPRTAVRSFVLLTLARSRYHRLLLAVFLGFGMALVLPEILRAASADIPGLPPVRTLAMPLILIFLAATGTRVLFGIPQEIEANWAFRMTETRQRDSYLTGAADAAVLICVVSIVALVTPLLWHGWGPRVALLHAAFCLVMGGVLVEALTLALRKIPFTCVHVPGSANIRAWWPVYLMAFTTYSFTMAALARAMMSSPPLAAGFFVAGLACWGGLRAWRKRAAATLAGFVYDEEEGEGVRSVVD